MTGSLGMIILVISLALVTWALYRDWVKKSHEDYDIVEHRKEAMEALRRIHGRSDK